MGFRAVTPSIFFSKVVQMDTMLPFDKQNQNLAQEQKSPALVHSNSSLELGPSFPEDTLARNSSLVTAASFQDLQCATNNSYSKKYWKVDNVSEVEKHLNYYLIQFHLYAFFGSIFLVLNSISFLVLLRFAAAVIILFFAVLISLCSYYGCRDRDWRLILAVSCSSVILLIYLTARTIVIIVTMVELHLPSNDLTASSLKNRQLRIASDVVEAILCFLFALFWGIVIYLSSRTICLLLTLHEDSQKSFYVANEPPEVCSPWSEIWWPRDWPRTAALNEGNSYAVHLSLWHFFKKLVKYEAPEWVERIALVIEDNSQDSCYNKFSLRHSFYIDHFSEYFLLSHSDTHLT